MSVGTIGTIREDAMILLIFLLFLVPSAWAEHIPCKLGGACDDHGGSMFIRMTEQQLVESQKGLMFTRVMLVDADGHPDKHRPSVIITGTA